VDTLKELEKLRTTKNNEWQWLGLVERWDWLARLALARMRELLTVPLPPADDLSTEAQSKRELLLLVAETAIGHARKAEEIMLRGDGRSDIIREIAALGARHLMRAFAWPSSAGLAGPRAIVA
jgi:hypothetical protein